MCEQHPTVQWTVSTLLPLAVWMHAGALQQENMARRLPMHRTIYLAQGRLSRVFARLAV